MKNKKAIFSSLIVLFLLFFEVVYNVRFANADGPNPFIVLGHYLGGDIYTRSHFQGYISISKTQYSPGETMNVTSLVKQIYFSSGGCYWQADGTVNGVTKDLFSTLSNCKTGNTEVNQFTVPTSPGNYTLNITPNNKHINDPSVEMVFLALSGGNRIYSITIPYTVVAPAATNGICGSSNGQTLSAAPTSSFCASGTYAGLSGTGPWNWSCLGQNGGSAATCRASLLGTCGLDNGQYLLSTPINLCTAGNVSTVSGAGPWNWTCGGTACSANKKYDCTNICTSLYSYAGATFQASDATCTTPIPTSFIAYSQNCSCGAKLSDPFGFTATCLPPTNGQCGSDNGQSFISPKKPTNLCSSGIPTATSGSWTWSCLGSNGGTDDNSCMAYLLTPINGQCGTDNGQTMVKTPTNLCTNGIASTVSGTGPWTWTCSGSNTGSTATCTAQKGSQLNPGEWTEVTP